MAFDVVSFDYISKKEHVCGGDASVAHIQKSKNILLSLTGKTGYTMP